MSKFLRHTLCLILGSLILGAADYWAQTPKVVEEPTGSISGRVTAGNQPAPLVRILLWRMKGNNREALVAGTTTDEDGHFLFLGLAAGQYEVEPEPGSLAASIPSLGGIKKAFTLQSGETIEGIDFPLVRGGVITGRVTDVDDQPLIQEPVEITHIDENGNSTHARVFSANEGATDDRGIYRFFGLAPGRYRVSLGEKGVAFYDPRGSWPKVYYPGVADPNEAVAVTVTPGAEVSNIDIKRGRSGQKKSYRITGRVVAADSGQLIPQAAIQLESVTETNGQSGRFSSCCPQSNAQGEFEFDGLYPGRYKLIVTPRISWGTSLWYGEPVTVELAETDLLGVELRATPALTLAGSLVIEGANLATVLRQLSQPKVNAFSSDWPVKRSANASFNQDGTFRLTGLQPGQVELKLVDASDGLLPPSLTIIGIEYQGSIHKQAIDLRSDQPASPVRIILSENKQMGSIRGQIKLEGGTWPPGLEFMLACWRKNPNARPGENESEIVNGGNADSLGRFHIDGLPPGEYVVSLDPIRGAGSPQLPPALRRQFLQTVTIFDGAETGITFVINLAETK